MRDAGHGLGLGEFGDHHRLQPLDVDLDEHRKFARQQRIEQRRVDHVDRDASRARAALSPGKACGAGVIGRDRNRHLARAVGNGEEVQRGLGRFS